VRVLKVGYGDDRESPVRRGGHHTGADRLVGYSIQKEEDQVEHHSVNCEEDRLAEYSNFHQAGQTGVHTDQEADQMAGDTGQDIHDRGGPEVARQVQNTAILAIQEVQKEVEVQVAEHTSHIRLELEVHRMKVHPMVHLVLAEDHLEAHTGRIDHLGV
jgi:hypothetical protein